MHDRRSAELEARAGRVMPGGASSSIRPAAVLLAALAGGGRMARSRSRVALPSHIPMDTMRAKL